LDLRNNSIPASSAAHLAAIISKKPLKELDTNMNELGASSDGMKALAEALEGNTSLESLSIGGNSVTEDGAAVLMAALQGNKTLASLDIGCVRLCEACMLTMQAARSSLHFTRKQSGLSDCYRHTI
jgi:Ran GTPase-activating protein (RanGAP) involved in mRNA processing and transport